ncbi:COG4223 family protein [Rhizobium sp. G187]|uniref:COG4223 family protein n=1 Tax=Rhizobium sp. G187 TaxID=3451352 RepID=UPI003EE48362
MVSGKPPRRSKSTDEPVIIDLKAEDSSIAPAGESASASVAAGDEIVSPGSADVTAAETGGVTSDIPPVEESTATSNEAEQAASSDAAMDARSEPPASETDDVKRGHYAEAQPSAAPVRPAPATSTLIASGILGGLVALALAGSMQYAGVLPSAGPDTDTPVQSYASAEDLEALKSEVARLAASSATPAAAAADPALAERLSALETAVASGINQQIAAVDTAALDELRAQLGAANQAIAALKGEVDTNRQALTDSSTRLADAERRLDEPRNDVEMARAIALAGLKTAIDRGGPFLSELDALKSVSPDDPAVTALSATATAGLSSRADLAREFPDVADNILAAVNAPAEGEGWSDRLLSSARSLVKVRPIGNVEGDTPDAIVARIENKLENGDLKGAHLEWQALPEVAKAASQDFAEKLDRRIKAEQVVSEALARTVAGNEG